MHYIGIDIGKRQHVCAVINTEGKTVIKPFSFANTADGFSMLMSKLENVLNDTDSCVFGMEATGHYWLNLYERLLQKNVSINVFNPIQVKAFRNQGIRGSKSDTIDAVLIAKVMHFGQSVQTKKTDSTLIALKNLTRYRADLTQEIAATKNKVICLLDQAFPEFNSLFSDMFGSAAMALLQEAATPEEIAALNDEKLLEIIHGSSRGRFGSAKVAQVKNAAQNSFGLFSAAQSFSFQIKLIISQIQHLNECIHKIDKEIEKLYAPLKLTLTSIPGIATTTAAAIISEIEDVQRFKNPRGGATALIAFAGMDPKLCQSGAFTGKAKMSKRGSRYLRRAIFNASFVAIQNDAALKAIYDKHRQKGKAHKVALSHVGTKMIKIVYSLLKNNTVYTANIT